MHKQKSRDFRGFFVCGELRAEGMPHVMFNFKGLLSTKLT